MKAPIEQAIKTFADLRIKYEGWDQTYIYDIGDWGQPPILRQCSKTIIEEHRAGINVAMWGVSFHEAMEMVLDEIPYSRESSQVLAIRYRHLSPAPDWGAGRSFFIDGREITEDELDRSWADIVADEEANPWKRAVPLSSVMDVIPIEPLTPFWHALNIMDWYHKSYLAHWDDVIVYDGWKRHRRLDFAHSLIGIAAAALEIGRSYEALLKKKFEPFAVRDMEQQKARMRGAEMRKGQTANSTFEILQNMKRLIEDKNLTVSSAANATFKANLGTSAGANRGLWYRHK
ncbi:hypothetical protein [uncultured Litoreibacter sp.]|uniref:hypothetical protein n=1 Tax=uncultured Litoreibacter sp. TaxID=1392394 RepID=UPI002604D95B|nr:hypothetical protein [uncultured Litoreibacter sp.]